MEKNRRKVNFHDEYDWRREVLDGDEIPRVTKKFAGKGCSGWKITGETFLT
jgi:hypothetical protein